MGVTVIICMVNHGYYIGCRRKHVRVVPGSVIASLVATATNSGLQKPFIIRIIAVTLGEHSKCQRLYGCNVFRLGYHT